MRAGLIEAPTDLVSADGSATYWEVRKLVRQALRADPNTLETLFVPSVRATDELGAWLLEAREVFPSKLIFGSFGRYALSQLEKLSSTQRLAEHEALVLAWLREDAALSLDALSVRLAHETAGDPHQAKTSLKQLNRSLWDRGALPSNDLQGLVAYARDERAMAEDPRWLRPKNVSNLLRLIELARGWLADGVPTFAVTGTFRERLLAIKRGAVPLPEVLAEAKARAVELEAAHASSRLPETADFERAHALVRRIDLEVARRFVQRVPGPWSGPETEQVT